MTEVLTDEQVEAEITRLRGSDAVRLARREYQYRNRRRQYMYQLRCYERRGEELIRQGYTLEDFISEPEPEYD